MSNFLVVSNRRITNAEYFLNPEGLEWWLGFHPEIDTLLFAFWSWKVPDSMLAKYKCYGMHTGFLLDGKGKGGSPIDNLQRLGIEWAALNVFEMNSEFDNGRVRLAIPLELAKRPIFDIVAEIDGLLPSIVQFLRQDISTVPERFKRIKNV